MTRIKALQILSTLSEEELADFDKFIISPFLNRSKDLIKLFNVIKKHYPDFKNAEPDFDKIYKKLYPGKKYNEGTIRNLFSGLGALAEKYLGYVVYEESSSYNYNLLLEMNHRDLPKLFLKHYEKSKKYENNIPDDTGLKNLYAHLLDSELSDFNIRRSNRKDEPEMKSTENLLIYLIKFFFLKNSNLRCESDNFNSAPEYDIVREFFERTDVEGLINIIESNNPNEGKKLKLLYFMEMADANKDNNFLEYLYKALDIFRSGKIEMSDREKFGVYAGISNTINGNMKSLDMELKRVLFEFKKEMVEKGITTEMFGKLTAIDFITIAEAALNVKEIEWAKNFIESKKDSVEDDMKSDLYNFNMARVLFLEKKYEASNECLSKVRQESIFFKIDIKVFRMKNYYELNFMEAAFSQAEALKQFLIRSDIVSEKRYKSYSNFLKCYFLLLKKKSGQEIDKVFIKDEILKYTSIRQQVWLLSKADEL